MASRNSTPQSRSRSSTGSSESSDATMLDAPPQSPSRPVRLRNPSTSTPSAASQAAASDPSFSLLLSLPRELRERIYTFTLSSSFAFWWPNQAAGRPDHVGVNLLRTNKQVYEESVSILYSANKFIFTHPSDCNIFRVVASPASYHITCVYFRIREKDLRLWTSYLGSKTTERSLKFDLPKLKSLWIFMRCGAMGTPAMLGQLGQGAMGMQGGGALAGLPPAVAVQVQAVHNALGQQVHALQQQVQNLTNAMANTAAGLDGADGIQPPAPPMPFVQFQQQGGLPHHAHQQHNANMPPPPPPPTTHPAAPPTLVPGATLPPAAHAHPHTLYTSFLRFEREMGIESLCLSLQETRRKDTEVKIVCIMRIPRREVERLLALYPDELQREKSGDARTRFRKLHGAEVSLEVNGYDVPGAPGGAQG
ncbi:hypothetical protein CC86DRAFT_369271 [Ophiobolus disseminans]|uniref:DUF7730 domain-containing protein n=1 Tax=Ophiobolus disseminans TaxID=1469910 RepID=A0A6A7A4A3_9PLEO|nr:hypothetical protein CC86DRAFT_369271 [Ophiobolus disseminans]